MSIPPTKVLNKLLRINSVDVAGETKIQLIYDVS